MRWCAARTVHAPPLVVNWVGLIGPQQVLEVLTLALLNNKFGSLSLSLDL